MTVVMSAAMREEFLAGVRVGVLSVAAGPAGQTLAVPVWYSYQPGGAVTVLTGRRSRKAAAIRAAGRFGLCVQDASPPYRYVSVEGPVAAEEGLEPAGAPAPATSTSPATQTPSTRPWPSGCARSTGSARTRAKGEWETSRWQVRE